MINQGPVNDMIIELDSVNKNIRDIKTSLITRAMDQKCLKTNIKYLKQAVQLKLELEELLIAEYQEGMSIEDILQEIQR